MIPEDFRRAIDRVKRNNVRDLESQFVLCLSSSRRTQNIYICKRKTIQLSASNLSKANGNHPGQTYP